MLEYPGILETALVFSCVEYSWKPWSVFTKLLLWRKKLGKHLCSQLVPLPVFLLYEMCDEFLAFLEVEN